MSFIKIGQGVAKPTFEKDKWTYFHYSFIGEEKQVAFWGVVSNALSNDGQSNLPPKDDEEVVRMTEIMFIFFLVCIGILLVYLVCSILLIFGAAKVRKIS